MCLWLLLLSLYQRWRLARALTYVYLLLQLLVTSYILSYNISTDGPTLGFALTGSLNLVGLLILYYSSAIRRYLDSPLPTPLA